ncbi:unnamed protein product [Brassica oleracea var. botrytis]|uniref:BnaC07g42250D protein n=3 Tax=Brassica TaxID=3705 RepID=A0A078I744_BRANA|nr:hypothetical protein HID58_078430 [Brassica napus]CAF2030114.1 unnamed protein product [Brassica napus]CDY46720.1 BnaC07g42250D [Brassica napus]
MTCPNIIGGAANEQSNSSPRREVIRIILRRDGGRIREGDTSSSAALQKPPSSSSGEVAVFKPQNQAQAGQGSELDQQQQPAHQRQVVVRRFEIAFQLYIFLILKLADGSRQRLAVLVIFATIIYLYQTGALAPFVRWLSQGMHRAAVPPPPRPNRPADNDPPAAAAVPLNEDAAPEGQENGADNRNRANANENVDAAQQGNQWWGIVKEIQMIVFGFITSLLPGFHNIESNLFSFCTLLQQKQLRKNFNL